MGKFEHTKAVVRLRWDVAALAAHGNELQGGPERPDWRTLFATYDPRLSTTVILPDARPDKPEKPEELLSRPKPLIVAEPGTLNQPMAFASYFHELLHWWQHVGTTSGLLFGLATPACCMQNHGHIRAAAQEARPLRKPLRHYSELSPGTHSATLEEQVNTAVNNWMDVDNGKFLLDTPERAVELATDPFFDCLGHSIRMLLEYTIGSLLVSLDDRQRPVMPDTRRWDVGFDAVLDQGVPGYRHGEKLMVPPFGMRRIAEAQARLAELQYLDRVSKFSWDDAVKYGRTQEKYTQALLFFCEVTGLDFPARPTSPEANLFLLLCDISLNPSVGYPDDIADYPRLLEEISPGVRFLRGCEAVRGRRDLCRVLSGEVGQLDGRTYDSVSSAICRAMRVKTPRQVAQTVVKLAARMPSLTSLRKEFSGNCDFTPNNMPIRYTFLKHLLMMEDKAKHPEFFCWPGWHFVLLSQTPNESAETLLRRHAPPFFAYGMNSPVTPTPQEGADPVGLERVAATYFKWTLIFDLYKQLISEDGAFCFEYSWLDPSKDEDWYREWLAKDFGALLGCDVGAIEPWPPASV